MADLTSETVRFTDHATTTMHAQNNPLESTFKLADTNDRIEGFLSRPQRIATFEWSPNVGFHETINPWALFMDNPKVRDRLSNFAFIRCNMHVRIMVNSTRFYYGRMMAAYTPMHQHDNITQFRAGVQADFVEASQRPCVIMDPTSDQVGELILPYMYPKSSLLIPGKEWNRMGTLTLSDLTVLRNANNSVDPITVTVFAWAEQVDYSQPTSQIYQVESGEYYDGPISKPAHKTARWLNHLANVPVIGPYARATEMVASAGAAVARLFGYSRPSVVTAETLFSPYHGKRLAATNFEDTADPLSLDAKKEIPIDPRITGSDGSDQMAFVPLAKRECYVGSFDWAPTQPADEFLFNIHVSPTQRFYETPVQVHTTPAGWISSLFGYWRGTTSIRFEAVCSSFHRGRLRIVYDPLYQVTDEYNVNYTHVMDLASETDYTMKVGWGQNVPYLEVDHLNSGNESRGTARFQRRIGNGVVTVYVVNSLTTPSESLDPITLNVYVSMNDDFEVQDPVSRGLQNLTIIEEPTVPPPIVPGDPPEQQEDVEEPPPNFAVSGPLNFSNFTNVGGTNVNISVADQAGTPDGYQAFVIAGDRTDQRYRPQVNSIRIDGLQPGFQELGLDFQTTGIGGPIAPLIWDGSPLEWTEDTPGVYTTSYREEQDRGSSITFPLSWPNSPGNPLLVTGVTAERAFATDILFMDSDRVTFNGLAALNTDRYGAFAFLGPQDSVTVDIPGATLTELAIAGTAIEPLTIDNGTSTTTVTTFAVGGFPGRTSPSVNIAGDVYTITNQGTTDMKLYSVVWTAPIGYIEPAQFIPESAEEELQPERPVIEQVAAGNDVNLPQVSDVFFGELPSSFRQIVKRYTMIQAFEVPSSTTVQRRLYANPRNTARGQVFPSDVSLWAWVMTPYLGWKGSVRHKVITGRPHGGVVTLTRRADGVEIEEIEDIPSANAVNIAWEGSTLGALPGQVAEAVIPWYSNLRFRNCRIGNPDTSFETAPGFECTITAGNRDVQYRQIASGGEDYTLNHWVSTPIVRVTV